MKEKNSMDESLEKKATQMISSDDIEMVRLGAVILEKMDVGTINTLNILDKNLNKKKFRYDVDMMDGEIQINEGPERVIRIQTGIAGKKLLEGAMKAYLYGRKNTGDVE